MNYDKKVFEREHYTVLDFLSDIGGVQSIFMTTLAIVLAVINRKHPETFMASRLFKISEPAVNSVEIGKSKLEISPFFEPNE